MLILSKGVIIMTQEDKELVFKDICARLPYGVHILVHDTFEYSTVPFQNAYLKVYDTSELIDPISLNLRYNSKDKRFNRIIKEHKDYLEITPCLFPLSSMSEEQKNEYNMLQDKVTTYHYEDGNIVEDTELRDNWRSIEYLNANHFDYRGLIEKGLAFDTTGSGIYVVPEESL